MLVALAGAAALAVAALPQAASAKATLKLQAEGVTLAAGAPLTASSANFAIAGEGVACQDTALGGEVLTNGVSAAATALFQTATFAGEAEGGECTSGLKPPMAHVHVELMQGAPLKLTLPAKLESASLRPTVSGKPGIEIAVRPLEEHPKGTAYTCYLVRAALTLGRYEDKGGELTVAFPAQPFRVDANSGKECGGKYVSITATFTFTSSGVPVTALFG